MKSSHSPNDDGTVDLREYIAVLRRRFWLIVSTITAAVALATAYSLTRTPVYTGTTVVLVQPSTESAQFRPDQLVSLDTEARLVKSAPVAALAGETLGSDLPRPEFLKRVDVEVTPDTLVLDVLYTDPSAQRAADGANAFAEAYLDYKEMRARDMAASERADIQAEIDDIEEEIAGLEEAVPGSSEERRAELLTAQVGVMTAELASVGPIADPGDVILPAIPPARPSSPKLMLNLAMAFMLGAFVGVVLAFIRDRTDDVITDLDHLESTVEFPVLVTIPHAAGSPGNDRPWLIMERQPRSPAAEAFRTLSTSVIALSRQLDVKTLAILSAAPGDGKTTMCANVGVALSHTDARVLLLAADLRRPTLAACFDVDLGVGMADVLMGEATLADVVQLVSPNLWLMTSGHPPERPAELLQSPRLAALLAEAREAFDFVLIDCPAVMGLADTLAVAPYADASIVIARVESSKRIAIVRAIERLEQVGVRFLGAVLNDVAFSKRTADYGYGYGHQLQAEPWTRDGAPEASASDVRSQRQQVRSNEAPPSRPGESDDDRASELLPHAVGQPDAGARADT